MDPSLIPQANTEGFSEEMDPPSIIVAFINCVGQSKLPISKQLEIQSFVCTNNVDILHLQECRIDDDSFAHCGYLTSFLISLVTINQMTHTTALHRWLRVT